MSVMGRVSTLCILAVLLVSAPMSGATEAAIYGSITSYGGAGKHPKSATSGLIIDARADGVKFICYSYSISTNSKIKGQVSGVVERITEDGVESLATFGKMKVQELGFGDPPPPSNDPCAPDFPDTPPDFNIGFAADCVQIMTTLNPDDIIRWRLNFKKAAKLKGPNVGISLFGSVQPFGGVTSQRLGERQAREWTLGRSLDFLLQP